MRRDQVGNSRDAKRESREGRFLPILLRILLWLVVALFAVLLIPCSIPSCSHDSGGGKTAKTGHQMASIKIAIEHYHQEYSKLPLPDDLEGNPDIWIRTDNSTHGLLRALAGVPSERAGSVPNPNKIAFLGIPYSDKGRGGAHPDDPEFRWLDPWGNPYFIALDADDSGAIDDPDPGTDAAIHQSVLVISAGPNHKPGTLVSLADIDFSDPEVLCTYR